MTITTKTAEGKKRTITLTGRPPVTLREDLWPVIARADGTSWSGSDYSRFEQARSRGELDEYSIRVRQHADGRTVVYAVFIGATAWTGSEDRRGGELLESGSDLAQVITRVGEDSGLPDRAIRECIADLPAEDLDEAAAAMGIASAREGQAITGHQADQIIAELLLRELPALDDGTGTLRVVVESAVRDGSISPAHDFSGMEPFRVWLEAAKATISEIVATAREDAAKASEVSADPRSGPWARRSRD
jgi:hypothetical protein